MVENYTASKKDGLTIITIVLNQELLIEETIKSVISQKGEINIQYIIIDGGSKDGTLAIINSYKQYISHIVSEPDDGIYYAINKGIALAQFSLIGLIHCGDYYKPGALFSVYEAFHRTNADVIYGDIEILEELDNNNLVHTYKASHSILHKRMSIFHPSTFIASRVYAKFGVYDTSFRSASDYELLLKAYTKNCIFFYIPTPLAVFRAGGISSKNFKLSLRENCIIRCRHKNAFNAIKYAIVTVFIHYLFTFRNFLIVNIIGKRNFDKLKYTIRNSN